MTDKKIVLTELQLEEMLPMALKLVEKQRREQREKERGSFYSFSCRFENRMEYLLSW